jgi:hypothetical protein
MVTAKNAQEVGQVKHTTTKPWAMKWLAQHIASGILLAGAVLAAAAALTTLIIAVEELIVLVVSHRWINTYTNIYGNAVQAVAWHFLIVFFLVAFWSALDTFTPDLKGDSRLRERKS